MKIICFSTHTAIWYFAFAQATIASVLQKGGYNVLFITSGKEVSNISNPAQERILRGEFNLKGYDLGAVLTTNDYKQIELLLKKINRSNFNKFSMNGILIGKIALYEFLLHNKKMTKRLTDSEWKECDYYLRNTLVSFFACRKIIALEKPDKILMFSTLYSVDHVWQKYAEQMSVPVYFMDHGGNLSDVNDTLMIGKTNPLYFFDKLKNIYDRIKNTPVLQNELKYVTENFLELLRAKHFLVYSAPKSKECINIRKVFGIERNQKILTATLSSYDELFAAKYVGALKVPNNLIFKDQIEWVRALINYTKKRQDLFLIIRVHPREFPNKRDGMKSEHAIMLEKILKDLPKNIKVNWPTDNISIYDLAQETDVFLNAWSSVGVEMSLLGIPVVIYSKDLISYPHDLNYLAKDKKDYFAKIELALKEGWSYERIKKTYRWLSLYYCHTIVRLRSTRKEIKQSNISKLLSGVISYFYSLIPIKLRTFLIKIYFMIPGLGVGKKQINDCRRQLAEHVDISEVDRMLKESGDTLVNVDKILKNKISEKDEDTFIRNEIKRIYNALYGSLSKEIEIEKDSLQYNLRQVFNN